MARRYRVHYGINDGFGYVVADSKTPGQDWRGLIVYKTDSKGDAEKKAEELNGG